VVEVMMADDGCRVLADKKEMGREWGAGRTH
jgi:hypothetical protein